MRNSQWTGCDAQERSIVNCIRDLNWEVGRGKSVDASEYCIDLVDLADGMSTASVE